MVIHGGGDSRYVDEILDNIRIILLLAVEEKRSITAEIDREYHNVPGDEGAIEKYESTGQMTIQIKTGLKGSSTNS